MRKTKTALLFLMPFLLIAGFGGMPVVSTPLQGPIQEEPPTPITVGTATEKQKEHSKFYDKDFNGPKLDAPVDPRDPRAKKELKLISPPPLEALDDTSPVPTIEDIFRKLTCEADAIVEGTVKDKTSLLMESKQYVFTEYAFYVEHIYKDNVKSSVPVNSSITVIGRGGRIQINGRIMSLYAGSWLPLGIGSRCLLFLKYIPRTDSYDSSLILGSYLVRDGELVKLTDDSIPNFREDGTIPFDGHVHGIISSNCAR